MCIPVELHGNERQKIPAVLVKIDRSNGLIKFGPESVAIRVPLSKLQLAPSAFEKCENVFAHTELGVVGETEPANQRSWRPTNQVSARDVAEVWLKTDSTTREKTGTTTTAEDIEANKDDSPSATFPTARGAWWPGRVLTIQGGFAHVEVAAPLSDNTTDDLIAPHIAPHVVRMGSALFPFRSTLVKLDEVRSPWNGRPTSHTTSGENEGILKELPTEPATLATPGVLLRHTICIPAYLARLAASVDSHSALVKFCESPCLIQCDPEPFLSHVLAKRILDECDSAATSGRQTPNHCTESEVTAPSVTVSADSQSSATPSWPSTCSIAQSSILNAPHIAGTLSPAGVTDPTLLLEGLPGVNGPLVLLHIWSGSSEAIRRAALLELAHVRVLVFRYHIMRKLSNGEPGELDLIDSTASSTENGDAPVMHCRPISIPVQSGDATAGDRSTATMIGYSAQFRITPQLVGLAIGHRGATIQEARSLPRVRAVELLHDGIVHVEAETVEACQSVRNLLDFTEAEIPVSPHLASRLIGSKGMNIRKLATSAGIRRALLLDPLTRKRRQQQLQRKSDNISPELCDEKQPDANGVQSNESTPTSESHEDIAVHKEENPASTEDEKLLPPAFYLLGTRQAVAKMRLLLEFQADNWTELDELEETRRNLSSQLRQSAYSNVRNSSQLVSGNSSDAGVRTHVPVPRGRGRPPSGRGGISADFVPDQEYGNRPFNRPFYRGRGRGGMMDATNPSQRQPYTSVEGSSDGAGTLPKDENVANTLPGQEQSQSSAAAVNGFKQGSERGGGRGRNRRRNQPITGT